MRFEVKKYICTRIKVLTSQLFRTFNKMNKKTRKVNADLKVVKINTNHQYVNTFAFQNKRMAWSQFYF